MGRSRLAKRYRMRTKSKSRLRDVCGKDSVQLGEGLEDKGYPLFCHELPVTTKKVSVKNPRCETPTRASPDQHSKQPF